MGCATSMVKYLLFFFNFLFVVGGAALVTIGALSFNGFKTYENFIDLKAYQAPPIGMMVVGGIIVLIAFMGCCGTVRESKCMMMTYATLLTILLIAEVAIAVGIYVYKDEFKDVLKDGLVKSMSKYDQKEIAESWDTMQGNLKCCGIDSYKDWSTHGITEVPKSCCVDGKNCEQQVSSYYPAGCLDKALADLKTEEGMYSAIVVAAVEVLGILFGCCLGARFGRKRYST